MATETPQDGDSGSELSQMMVDSSNVPFAGPQQHLEYQSGHGKGADVATVNMTEDADLKIVPKTASSKNKKQHAVGCSYIHTRVNSAPLTG